MVITRTDINHGYQTVQSTHAIADFIHEYPELAKKWKDISNSIICLGVKNETELLKLFNKFLNDDVPVTLFREPDINNQATSLCIFAEPNVRKKLKHLPLIGKEKYNLSDVLIKMHQTPQTETQSVLDHGLSVNKYYNEIVSILKHDQPIPDHLKIPEHIIEQKKFILSNLLDDTITTKYQIYHDIGKPYCIFYDEHGKKHFPKHHEVSQKVYSEVFKYDSDVEIVSKLIYHDMDFHILKPSQVDEYLEKTKLSTPEIVTLMVTTLSEILSNSKMFGGFESDSFKIKFKNYSKITKRVLEQINKQLK